MDARNTQLSNTFPTLFTSLLRVTGVLPLDTSFRLTNLRLSYSLLLLVVCILVKLFSFSAVQYFEAVKTNDADMLIANTDRGSILTRFVKGFYPVIMSSSALASIMNAAWRAQTHLPEFLNHLHESNRFLKTSEEFLKKQKDFKWKVVKWSLGLSIPMKFMSIFSLVLLQVIHGFVMTWVVGLYFLDLVGFLTDLQFCLMCNVLRFRFKELNKTLQNTFLLHDIKLEYRMRNFALNWSNNNNIHQDNKLCTEKGLLNTMFKALKFWKKTKVSDVNESNTKTIFVVPLEKRYFSQNKATFLYKDFANVSKASVSVSKADFSKQLYNLRLCHRHLSKALRHLKSQFEFFLLISVFTSFLMILLNVYFVIYGLLNLFILSDRFDLVFWIIKSTFRYSCPLIMCDLTTKEATKTLQLLGGYASQTLTKSTEDEIDYFCKEIASRDLTIKCAFNLFVLKSTLLTAAVAAGTTYIVILVQLH